MGSVMVSSSNACIARLPRLPAGRSRVARACMLGCAIAGAGACGGISLTEPPPSGDSGTAYDAGHRNPGYLDAGVPERDGGDAGLTPFNDPGCAEAGPPAPAIHECDPFSPFNGDCPAGEGCYPYAETHGGCAPPESGSLCLPSGAGTQGDVCSGADDCSPGHVCVVSGSGNVCVQICPVNAVAPCPRGFVCHNLDVEGYGGCL